MNVLKSCCICHHFGAEMHSDTVTKWKFNGVDESSIKDEVYYKVWLEVNERTNREQHQPYTCEVYWFEEVPKEIIEAEKLVQNYWASKDPKKGIRRSGFQPLLFFNGFYIKF